MNSQQRQISDVLWAILNVDSIEESFHDSAIRYGILNYVAKYSLARNTYYVTETSLKHLGRLKLLGPKGLRRGSKSIKNGFTYEHPVPSNVIADQLFSVRTNRELFYRTLAWSDLVTVLTTQEDKELASRYISSMPDGWAFFADSPFARYEQCEIQPPPYEMIEVYGALAR
jgi:hypothetical protein